MTASACVTCACCLALFPTAVKRHHTKASVYCADRVETVKLFQPFILTKNINASCKVLVPCFISWNKRSLKFSISTKCLFFSNVVHKFVYIPHFTDHFSFAKIIHPPDRWGISRSWLNSMIITQMHLVLGKIKGHSKMCRLSHNTMPQMSQILRECAIGMLTAGMSTRAIAR